jgi:superfamily II DNA/RNA helicase
MDGRDLLASTPTGLGKTGFLFMLMLVVRDISADETLALGQMRFPKDLAMIIVCPTKALEKDMVCSCQLSIMTT